MSSGSGKNDRDGGEVVLVMVAAIVVAIVAMVVVEATATILEISSGHGRGGLQVFTNKSEMK